MRTFFHTRDRFLSDDSCLYKDQKNYGVKYASLHEDISTEICIIGGGFTGLITAYHLIKAGQKDVTLVERHRVGWGASGRSSGQILPGFNKGVIKDIANMYGEEKAAALYRATLDAVATIKQIFTEIEEETNFVSGIIIAAPSQKRSDDLAAYKEYLEKIGCGENLSLKNKEETRDAIGSELYVGGLIDLNGGHFNPLKYLNLLAKYLVSKGLNIYENTPALKIDKQDSAIEIETPAAIITAQKIVLAGDAYQGWLFPETRKKYVLARTSMLATQPLRPNVADTILSCNHACFEWQHLLHYFAKTKDNRLIFGGGDGSLFKNKKEEHRAFESLYKEMVHVFPQLKNAFVTHWWGGYLGVTVNQTPEVGGIEDRIYYAFGYSGHGVLPTHMCAKIIADMIVHKDAVNIMAEMKAKTIPGAGYHDNVLVSLGLLWEKFQDKLF
jgi:gamma-glutamylputrescine oxidase